MAREDFIQQYREEKERAQQGEAPLPPDHPTVLKFIAGRDKQAGHSGGDAQELLDAYTWRGYQEYARETQGQGRKPAQTPRRKAGQKSSRSS